MIALAAVLIVLLIFWDVFRPEHPPRRAVPAAGTAGAGDTITRRVVRVSSSVVPPPAIVPEPTPPPVETIPEDSPPPRELSYIELLARSETRRRIRASGTSTYLADMVTASGDSTLRRWDNRKRVPVRVWITSTNAANFKPAFVDATQIAFDRWTGVGVPVRFVFGADSSSAEVTVRWRMQFEIERTGQTDLTWDADGQIQSALVTLATFDPKGRPLDTDDIRVVAMHEVGHVLGLDHSKDSTDIMFPTAKVRDLSDRDIRTAILLYQLTPGSLR